MLQVKNRNAETVAQFNYMTTCYNKASKALFSVNRNLQVTNSFRGDPLFEHMDHSPGLIGNNQFKMFYLYNLRWFINPILS